MGVQSWQRPRPCFQTPQMVFLVNDRNIEIVDQKSGARLQVKSLHDHEIVDIHVHEDLALTFDNGTLRGGGTPTSTAKVWNVPRTQDWATTSKQHVAHISLPRMPITLGRIFGKHRVVLGTKDGQLVCWDLCTHELTTTESHEKQPVKALAFSDDQGLVAIGFGNGKIVLGQDNSYSNCISAERGEIISTEAVNDLAWSTLIGDPTRLVLSAQGENDVWRSWVQPVSGAIADWRRRSLEPSPRRPEQVEPGPYTQALQSIAHAAHRATGVVSAAIVKPIELPDVNAMSVAQHQYRWEPRCEPGYGAVQPEADQASICVSSGKQSFEPHLVIPRMFHVDLDRISRPSPDRIRRSRQALRDALRKSVALAKGSDRWPTLIASARSRMQQSLLIKTETCL